MKRSTLIVTVLLITAVVSIVAANRTVLSILLFGPSGSDITESWEVSNQTYRLRVERRAERVWGPIAGAQYVFRSAPPDSDAWREVMTFRHDDPVPIPRDQVRFVNERVGYVFMGWVYAVTTDGGTTWSVWNAETDLPKWACCNYRLIGDVNIEADGTGTMTLNPIPQRQSEVPRLTTNDFGRHWNL